MTVRRYHVLKDFRHYVTEKDNRSMDEICKSDSGEFKLQVQQKFLRDYIRKNPSWDKLVLYHEIGAGKTCTAITMAEEYLRTNPTHKVRIILPARLRTNFLDELISPCGMDRYISREDFKKYHDPSTPKGIKNHIKGVFMRAIHDRYDIMSFEKFRIEAMRHRDRIAEYMHSLTHNSIIIIDEVHNLLSRQYNEKSYQEFVSQRSIIQLPKKKYQGMVIMVFKLMLRFASSNSKMVFMTATPIFDNISQIKELIYAFKPELQSRIPSGATVGSIIEYLRGKVSYFPGTSKNAYPSVSYTNEDVVMSELQDITIHLIQLANEKPEDGEEKAPFEIPEQFREMLERDGYGDGDENEDEEFVESFMAKQRQASMGVHPSGEVKNNVDDVVNNLRKYSPKIHRLVENIQKDKGKHFAYTNFVKAGVDVIAKALQKKGWVCFNDDYELAMQLAAGEKKYKVFAIWDGRVQDRDKQHIKSVINNINNIDGKNIRVVIGSPSTREGISFKHIQHMHLLDPLWNYSAKSQVEGRAIRFCSHSDIDPTVHKGLERTVKVHVYMLRPRPGGFVEESPDEILDRIMLRKKDLVEAGESALKKVAIDYFLFRKMYNDEPLIEAKSNQVSPIGIDEKENVYIDRGKKLNKGSTCPKKRRPTVSKVNGVEVNTCDNELYPVLKENKQKFPCCYKSATKAEKEPKIKVKNPDDKKKKSPCPKSRRPIDGECKTGFKLKVNKSGIPCCYNAKRDVKK